MGNWLFRKRSDEREITSPPFVTGGSANQDAVAPQESMRYNEPTVPLGGKGLTIRPGHKLRGSFLARGDLHIQGTIEGEVVASGTVSLANYAKFQGTARVKAFENRGFAEGTVVARGRVLCARGSTFIGSAQGASIEVQDGALFEGSCTVR